MEKEREAEGQEQEKVKGQPHITISRHSGKGQDFQEQIKSI